MKFFSQRFFCNNITPAREFQETSMKTDIFEGSNAVDRNDKVNKSSDEAIHITQFNEAYDVTPIADFSDEGKFKIFRNELQKLKFDKLTPIQSYGIPVVMADKDMVGIAKTGSGKTLAFMLPCIQHSKKFKQEYVAKNGTYYNNSKSPVAVVLSPTRELTNQIYESSVAFAKEGKCMIRCVYGGRSIETQAAGLERGADILIGTPGRIIDLVDRGMLDLNNVCFFVLDEADRMLDMGFMPQIQSIIENLNKTRQTVMFSATWPKEVEELSGMVFQNEPVQLKIGDANLTVNDQIEQMMVKTQESNKMDELMKILEDEENSKVLIFSNKKVQCSILAEKLSRKGYRATDIHGDKSQAQRDNAMNDFKSGRVDILIATDVASRGLDVRGIKAVVNYDFPQTIEDYVHRIGRTGRAGAVGKSMTFITEDDNTGWLKHLLKFMGKANQTIPDWLHEFAPKSNFRSKNNYRGARHEQNSFYNRSKSSDNAWTRSYQGGNDKPDHWNKSSEGYKDRRGQSNRENGNYDRNNSNDDMLRENNRNNEGYQGNRNNERYQGNRNNEGYQGNRNNERYQGNRNNEGYQGNRNNEGYQGNRNNERYQGNRNNEGYKSNETFKDFKPKKSEWMENYEEDDN